MPQTDTLSQLPLIALGDYESWYCTPYGCWRSNGPRPIRVTAVRDREVFTRSWLKNRVHVYIGTPGTFRVSKYMAPLLEGRTLHQHPTIPGIVQVVRKTKWNDVEEDMVVALLPIIR